MTSRQHSEPEACDRFADLLVDLSDGELPDEQRPAIEAHLAGCSHCRTELQRLNASLARLRSGFAATEKSLVRSSMPQARLRSAIVVAASAGLACLLLVVGLGWLVSAPKSTAKSPSLAPSQPAAILSQADALRQIAFIEQQARLQTSLDLMPNEPWYADQRAENEQLVAKLKSAALYP
jgi:anti-sigma factor RsiW